MLIEIFEHDILVANDAWFGPGSTCLCMLLILHLCPSIFAVLANNRLSRANLFVALEKFRHDHLTAKRAFFLFMKLFLMQKSAYIMLFLIFDIDHLITVLTFADVSAAIGLVKVDAINWKWFVAVGTFLIVCFHFSYYSNKMLFQFLQFQKPLENHLFYSYIQISQKSSKITIKLPNYWMILISMKTLKLWTQVTKIIILYQVIMKQQKYKEEAISGWANEGDTNYDAIMLANILIRKTNAGTLPQIPYVRNKTEMEYQNYHKGSQLFLNKSRYNHKSNHTLKMKREKTEGYECELHESPAFKEQNKQFVMNQIKLFSDDSHHQVGFHQNVDNMKRYSHISEEKINLKGLIQNGKRELKNSIFSKTMKTHANGTKSQDAIQKTINLLESSKNSQQRLYMKLNALGMGVNKSQFRYGYMPTLNEKSIKANQSENLLEKRKRKNDFKIKTSSIDKMKEKLKSTFTKKDIFHCSKRKTSRSDNVEFNDQVIFSNNSIVVSKQIMTNPFLYSKIQIMKPPNKSQFVLK